MLSKATVCSYAGQMSSVVNRGYSRTSTVRPCSPPLNQAWIPEFKAAVRLSRVGERPQRQQHRLNSAATEASTCSNLTVEVESGSEFNSKALFAGIEINAPHEIVWEALTSYNSLQEFIPGLKENEVVETRKNGALVRQVGQEDLALGVKFTAAVLLDIQEHKRGLPGNRFGEGKLPTPKGEAYSHMDISFELVEGDFQKFNGVWRIQPGAAGRGTCRLTYAVLVQPSPWLPVKLVQGRVKGEIGNNLQAVRAFSERKYKARSSHLDTDVEEESLVLE